MLRFLLLSILLTLLYRAVSRLWAGIVRGMQESGAAAAPGGSRTTRGSVQMSRDPVCGTFVVPERAIALSEAGGHHYYFCSTACRDAFIATRPTRLAPQGRTA